MSRGLAGALMGLCVLLWTLSSAVQAQPSPPAADGTISGTVIDKGTGEPMIDAGVEVVGTQKRARTDLDGKYSIKIAPGTYQVRFFQALYQGARIDDVKVVAGGKATVDAALAPEGKGAVETVEVVAKADKQADTIQLLERKNAATVADNIGAQTIKESSDSSAAEVVERAPAVTVRDGKFVYIRGLGERYSAALLNGSKLPSTDPNKRVVPLDIFPSDFIQSLSIIKGYTPDLPGDFSGGLVDIELKEPPEKLSYSIGVSSSGDTNTTFNSFQNYSGTSGDAVGFGKGSRSLPGIVPDTDIDSCLVSPCTEQKRVYAGAFKNIWTPDSQTAPPNFGVNASVGDTFGPLGISLAGVWGNEYQINPTEIANTFTSSAQDPLTPFEQFTYKRSTQVGRLGGVLTSSYTINPENRITFRAFDDHVGTDYVLTGSGTTINATTDPPVQSQTTLYYQEQNLGYGQLAGEHHIEPLTVEWRSALSQTTMDAPDSRYITRNLDGSFYTNSASGLRTFLDLSEWLTDSAVDFTLPWKTWLPFTDAWSGLPAKFKFGPAYTYRSRDMTYRRFRWDGPRGDTNINTTGPAEQFLIPANVGYPEQYRSFDFLEDTRPSDQFDATQEIAALYALIDTPIIPDKLRLITGVRLEYSYITIDGSDLSTGVPIHNVINDLNPLPGFNLVYSPQSDMNVRFGFSRTTSRPEFRELTPTEFVEPNGFRRTIGNPNLVSATIDSYDLRWEWFLSPLELVSFGAFYKSFDQPIEQIVVPGSSSIADSWANDKSAQLAGFEFEARKNFSFLVEPAKDYVSGAFAEQMPRLSLLMNVSYVWSHAQVEIGENDIQAESDRPLQGQAPFVVNAGLQYEWPEMFNARLMYNTAGSSIAAVGTKVGNSELPPMPSINDSQRGQLDFVVTGTIKPFDVPINAKFAIENILNSAYEQTQGDEIVSRLRDGVQFGVSFSYSFN